MNRPIEFIKEHPAGIAISVFVVGVLYLVLRGKGATNVFTTNTGPTADEVQSGTALQLATIQAQQQSNQINAQAGVANHEVDAQVTMTQLQTLLQGNTATLQADVAKTVAGLQAQTTEQVSTLQAQVANTQSNNQLAAIIAATQGEVSIAMAPYQVQSQQIAAARDVALADITTQASANSIAIGTLQTNLAALAAQDNASITSLTTQFNTLKTDTGTVVADINAYSNRSLGTSLIYPISEFSGAHTNLPGIGGGYVNP